ncbi:MAG: hypothetical protein FWE19_00990 [Oscillospiraceae bacterium]|nr:hypothetical protein [Oscillospiraceae bacterium]
MCRSSRFDTTSARFGGPAATFSAEQVMDSCCERECLEDLQVFFEEKDQIIIENCVLVRNPMAELEAVDFEVEPIPLREGCFTVDMAMRFRVRVDAFLSREDRPHCVSGTTYIQKRDILFGGDCGASVFRSGGEHSTALPQASLQMAEPVVLSCRLAEVPTGKAVLITMGIFSVTSLDRPARLAVPASVLERAAALTERRCSNTTERSDCEVFETIRFPEEQFRGRRRRCACR